MRAKIFTDEKLAGQPPGMVALERNCDHILTLIQAPYI